MSLLSSSVARMGEGRGCTRFWWGNLRERPRSRWEDNIKMDLQEVGGGCGDWIELAQDRTGGGHL